MDTDSFPQDGVSLTQAQRAFLAAYIETGIVCSAAKAAGISRWSHYKWMRDENYAQAFEEADIAAGDTMEAEARRRAIEGLKRYKFGRNGEPLLHPVTKEPYYEHVYSDNLLSQMMRARNARYRDTGPPAFAGPLPVTEVENFYGSSRAHQAEAERNPASEAPPAPTADP
jgi:hypothetical protein